ncbi:methyltransferase [Erythrobacter sp. HKB08]|uniref:methyltransferase n=1 Tax=Erythrobacter sp. HKB08 TaxID=2502843 RepID=UPI00100930BC|nr:methyltransferase [Erythrobacter sp. HKB08]
MQGTRPPTIFSSIRRSSVKDRSASRQRLPDAARYLVEAIADDVEERLGFMNFEAANILLLGDRGGVIESRLRSLFPEAQLSAPLSVDEGQPLPSSDHDLIVSAFDLATVNDLPGALIHLRSALASGGLLIAAFPGAGSLSALRRIMFEADGERVSPRIHPQVDSPSAAALLQRAGFTRQVVDSWPVNVRYSSLTTLVSDLRDHGMTSTLASPAPPVGKAGMQRAQAAFERLSDDEGKLPESFEILSLTGWKT